MMTNVIMKKKNRELTSQKCSEKGFPTWSSAFTDSKKWAWRRRPMGRSDQNCIGITSSRGVLRKQSSTSNSRSSPAIREAHWGGESRGRVWRKTRVHIVTTSSATTVDKARARCRTLSSTSRRLKIGCNLRMIKRSAEARSRYIGKARTTWIAFEGLIADIVAYRGERRDPHFSEKFEIP